MRTAVDPPPDVHRLGEAVELATDPVSGVPALSLGRPVSAAEVAAALDDE